MFKPIILWYNKSARSLPWRETKDPYKIWLSEIILQQTRVEQGITYYNKFILNYPTIYDLAEAELDYILLLWQGLGYYSRARNLHIAAKYIVENFNGKFPANIKELKKIKGVGDYTAAAIGSIAFNIPEAAVDGNVYRVLSRYFEVSVPIDTTTGKKYFYGLANEVLDMNAPGIHNQAMMELGARICKPKSPVCPECPVQEGCAAYANKSVNCFPVKNGKTIQRNRYFYFLNIRSKYKKVIIEKRKANDIWKGLYQFPLIEVEKQISKEELIPLINSHCILKDQHYQITNISEEKKHILSHQIIYACFIEINININTGLKQKDCHHQFIEIKDLDRFAFPRLITRYLEDIGNRPGNE